MLGQNYNRKKIHRKYLTDSVNKEAEKISRLILLLIIAFVSSGFIYETVYTIIDWRKNEDWYVYKHWFPPLFG
jgi:hypothetical protein